MYPIYLDQLDDMHLSSGAFRVYCHLAGYANDEGEVPPASIDSTSQTCRMRDTRVNSSIRELESRRMLEVIRSSGLSNSYRLTDPSTWSQPDQDDQPNDIRLQAFSTEKLLDELERRKIALYQDPVEEAGERLLAFCVDLAQGEEQIEQLRKWASETRKCGFRNIALDYWDKEVIPKIANPAHQQRVAQLAADLHTQLAQQGNNEH